ncbi:Alpha/Beta hydrolase protein [Hygrophoropsis aurantiaca]|uniref:Alpha/Beta hydrolase protein n=1 Tax=Hygrophoropsis aurantiaca TaxID=72124 RepID=A0ACB8ANV4_9AGAM|nr:Alpha/Beta hydrolase protein [Hygrophoropsis aurantiaca]
MSQRSPYGTWKSPIDAPSITQNSITISDVFVDPIRTDVYHIERRPSENGRSVIVKTRSGLDVFDEKWNARTAVHEYGGCAAIAHDGAIYFSHVTDGRVYKIEAPNALPVPVTPDVHKVYRYGNFATCPFHPTLLVCVLEDHTKDTPQTVINTLCAIDTTSQTVHPLVSGADFYAAPSFSPDGTKLIWQEWNHPDMPWTGSAIYIVDVTLESQPTRLSITNRVLVAGRDADISVSFASWLSNDAILFLSDANGGYRNPWKYSLLFEEAQPVLNSPIAEDFGPPYKTLGMSPYAPLDPKGESALFVAYRDGRSVLYVVDLVGGAPPQEIRCPFVDIMAVRQVDHDNPEVVFSGLKSTEGSGVTFCHIVPTSSGFMPNFRPSTHDDSIESTTSSLSSFISLPRPMTLKCTDGKPLYVVYYAPFSPAYSGSNVAGEQPPCVLNVHGGPTNIALQTLDWTKQYFTSRGWAWLDVNYSGSSTYGRAYMERLKGNWGELDVQDCIDAAQILSSPPYSLIDLLRTVIRGGSAGGFAVLAAASTAKVSVFAAGTASYGISNLISLGNESHKFELRYLEGLMGGSDDEVHNVYVARSPIFHAENIVIPLLVLHGADDRIVPKNQSEEIVAKIQAQGGKVKYKLFDGEGHGWQKAETKRVALEEELKWYNEVLGLSNA